MIPVVSVEQMRKCDAARYNAREGGSKALMQLAGESIFRAVKWQGPVAVVCGVGNNAGDGYVLAALLFEAGIPCRIFLLKEKFSADGRAFFERCQALGVPWEVWEEGRELTGFACIADCLFGTGFAGLAQGKAAALIECVNRAAAAGARVIAADIPSGLSGDTGLGAPAVRAERTVSIGFLKKGHVLNAAKDHCGAIRNENIGIPLLGEADWLAERADLAGVIAPRPHHSHKGTYGTAALLGGCLQYGGAAKLANLSLCALRAGAGISRLCVPRSLMSAVGPYMLESTLCPLAETATGNIAPDPASLKAAMEGAAALGAGMGLGRYEEGPKVVKYLLNNFAGRLLLDADGLNALAVLGPEALKDRACAEVVLTPHPKEFERLSGVPAAEAAAEPGACARAFAERYGVTVLLKGTATTVTDGKRVWYCDRGAPGMATAGSGDVLSGVITGLLAHSRASAAAAALCGAWLCGTAGELAQARVGAVSMTASDTVKELPAAVRKLLEESE